MLDPKDGNADLLPALIREARAIDPKLLDRLIPQVLTLGDLRSALQLYPWPSVIWTLYATGPETKRSIETRSGAA